MPRSSLHPALQTTEASGAEKLAGLVIAGCTRSTAPRNTRDAKRHVFFPREQVASANGAITIRDAVVLITKGSLCALTLAAPSTAENGTRITIISTTAYAHTVTAPSAIIHWGDSGGADDVATFAAYAGASMTVIAYGGAWYVENLNGVTLA